MIQTGTSMSVTRLDVKLELDIIPVSDVGRSKEFSRRLCWGFAEDVAPSKG
jgi:hypothetical protein